MMYREPKVLRALLSKLTDGVVDYLNAQIEAGAQAVQLFDTWAGLLAPANQQSMLTAVGHANPDLHYSLAVGRHWLNPGHVLIVPAACRLEFSKQGLVVSVRDQWGTSETPSIDHLMMTMSGMSPSPAGAIIFSGAGSDGSAGLRALQAVGTRIWAQDPATAVSPSMPQSALDLGLVAHSAGPTGLAAEFMRLYHHQRA